MTLVLNLYQNINNTSVCFLFIQYVLLRMDCLKYNVNRKVKFQKLAQRLIALI